MSKTTIYVLGTTHSSSKSKSKIERIFNEYKFDAVFLEGPRDLKISSYINIDPFLMFFLYFWRLVLVKEGSEFNLAKDLCKKSNIPFHNIDLDFDSLFKKFHKWYNPLIFMLLLLSLLLFHITLSLIINQNPAYVLIGILLSFLLAETVYFGVYFNIFKTKRMRDINFVDSTKKIVNENNYSSVLVIFGKGHRKYYKKNFDVKNFNLIDLT